MVLFVSSTERPTFRSHLPAHKVSTLPERYGCDVLWNVGETWWGVQRKEISDFIASVQDGRLAKEVGQMRQTEFPMVILEGDVRFSGDVLIWDNWGGKDITKKQWMGMTWSLQRSGVAVNHSRNAKGTAEMVVGLMSWSQKPRHSSVTRRPGAVGSWGTPSSREFGEHLLMGLPGVGPELAARLYEKFGGVPWDWTCEVEDLMTVPGIGKAKATQMIGALRYAA
jgi:ERCC4-type nuclease